MIKPINAVDIDRDLIERESSCPPAYAMYFILSDIPDELWEYYFYSNQQKTAHMKNGSAKVVGNKLRFVFTGNDNLKDSISYVRELVEKTNSRICDINKELTTTQRDDMELENIKSSLRCLQF